MPPKKQRFPVSGKTLMSLFIAAIMLFSMLGYAVMQAVGPKTTVPENPLDKTYFVNRALSPAERVYIVRMGRMLIENFYNVSDPSGGEIAALTEFAAKYPVYVFVEQAPVNESVNATGPAAPQLKVIGRAGDIRELDPSNITEESLFDLLCEFGLRVPVECTLREM